MKKKLISSTSENPNCNVEFHPLKIMEKLLDFHLLNYVTTLKISRKNIYQPSYNQLINFRSSSSWGKVMTKTIDKLCFFKVVNFGIINAKYTSFKMPQFFSWFFINDLWDVFFYKKYKCFLFYFIIINFFFFGIYCKIYAQHMLFKRKLSKAKLIFFALCFFFYFL